MAALAASTAAIVPRIRSGSDGRAPRGRAG